MKKIIAIVLCCIFLNVMVIPTNAIIVVGPNGQVQINKSVLGESTIDEYPCQDKPCIALPPPKIDNDVTSSDIQSIMIKPQTDDVDQPNITIQKTDNSTVTISEPQTSIQTSQGQVEVLTSKTEPNVEIIQSGISATTTESIKIEPSSQTLTIESDAGSFPISLMPDNALQSLTQQEVIVDGSVSEIKILVEDNQAVYQINNIKKEKFVGLILVQIQKELTVSATSGKLIQTQQSLVNRVIDTLSF